MKRYTAAQVLLCTTLRIRPLFIAVSADTLLGVSSPPTVGKYRSDFNTCRQQQRWTHTTTTGPAFHVRSWWPYYNCATKTQTFVTLRGGSDTNISSDSVHHKQDPAYTVLSSPAPGSPFHHAFPVHDLDLAKEFYGTILGCAEGRSSTKWQDYSLHGHQIVAHWVGDNYRCQDYYNPVDGDEVPVPHTGLALTVDQFHELANRLRNAGVQFIIEPHLRFKGMPGEQYTMFFKDPSGNNLEFKAMTNPQNLFAKYNVDDY